MKYDYLIGNETSKGIIITEDLLNKAVNNLISKRRNKEEAFTESDEEIIDLFITEQDVLTSINSAANLQAKKADTSVKFDDVRNMDLSLENWDTYTVEERKFAQGQLNAYNEYYDLDAPNDKTGIYDIIDLEVRMQTIRVYLRLSKKKDEILEYDKQLKELRLQWSKALDDLNLKKKQRDNTKSKPKENFDLAGTINRLDKSPDDITTEALKDKQQEEIMIKQRNQKTTKETKK